MNVIDYVGTLKKQYFDEYVPSGGSCVKFAIGSHEVIASFKNRIVDAPGHGHFLVASATANAGALHPLNESFFQIAKQVDWTLLARYFLVDILSSAGWEELPQTLSIEALSKQSGLTPMQVEGEINRLLATHLYNRSGLLPEFQHCFATLVWGNVFPEDYSRQDATRIALEWLRGDIKYIHHCRPIHIYKKITITNARAALTSMCSVSKQAGFRGVILFVDFSAYVTPVPGGRRYTKTHVMQFYQTLRQFIDSIDELESTLLVFTSTPDFVGDSPVSYKSYQALRLRLTNEAFAVGLENPLAPLVDIRVQ